MDILVFIRRRKIYPHQKHLGIPPFVLFLLRQPKPTSKNPIPSKSSVPLPREAWIACPRLWSNDIASQEICAGLPLGVSVETTSCRHCVQYYSKPRKALILINQTFYLNASNLFWERQSYSESDLSQHIPLILSSMSSVNTVFKII